MNESSYTHYFHGSIVGNSPQELADELRRMAEEIEHFPDGANYGCSHADFDAYPLTNPVKDVYEFIDQIRKEYYNELRS